MSILYNRLSELCEQRAITGYRMAKDTNISTSLMTDLKMGRKKSISAEVADKLAAYFEVSVGYLLGTEDDPGIKKPPSSRTGEKRNLCSCSGSFRLRCRSGSWPISASLQPTKPFKISNPFLRSKPAEQLQCGVCLMFHPLPAS